MGGAQNIGTRSFSSKIEYFISQYTTISRYTNSASQYKESYPFALQFYLGPLLSKGLRHVKRALLWKIWYF